MDDILYTKHILFEKNLIIGNTPLFALVTKRAKDDKVKHVAEHSDDYFFSSPQYKEGYITRICDVEKGKCLYIVDALNTGAINCFLETQQSESLKYAGVRRSIARNFKGQKRKVCLFEVVDDIAVWRIFGFYAGKFEEGVPHGYKELTRICFRNGEYWKECSDGKKYGLNIDFLANTGCYREYNMSVLNEDEATITQKLKKLYPELNRSICRLGQFIYWFARTYRSTRIFKCVPDAIREDLFKSSLPVHSGRKNIPKQGFVKSIRSKKFIGFYYFSPTGTNIERVYFLKERVFKFGFNTYTNTWMSTNKKHMRILECRCPIKANTNTLLDYYIRLVPNHYATFRQIFFSMQYPLVEKLYKLGFNTLLKYIPYPETKNYRLNEQLGKIFQESEDVVMTLSPCELFGVSKRQLKFIPKDMDATCTEKFIMNFKNKDARDLFPDIQNRIDYAVLMAIYNPWTWSERDELCHLRKEQRLYIGKIASGRRKSRANDPCRLLMLYMDYERFRAGANQYNQYLDELNRGDCGNRSVHYYPEFPKVSQLQFYHDKAHRDYMYYKSMEEIETTKLRDEKIRAFVSSDEYTQFLYEDDEFCILPVTNSKSLVDEGSYLSHCVGGYTDAVADGKSYIYFLRKKKDMGTPYFTLEIRRDEKEDTPTYALSQCYTFHDTIEKSKRCKTFIEKWCKDRKIEIRCDL